MQKIGLPYWFCRIKNGRDEFMFLNTEDLIKNDLLYDSKTGEERDFSQMTEKEFMKNVLKALENKPEDGGVWIPICEPSSDKDGGIQFVKGQRPLVSMNLNRIKWKLLLTKYSPENYSKMLSIHTWFLLGLRFIKDGIATADQLANDSTGLGHYYDRSEKDYVCGVEKAGKRELGGVSLIGNTCKLVEDPSLKGNTIIVGGDYYCHSGSYPFGKVSEFEPILPRDFEEGKKYAYGENPGHKLTFVGLPELKAVK